MTRLLDLVPTAGASAAWRREGTAGKDNENRRKKSGETGRGSAECGREDGGRGSNGPDARPHKHFFKYCNAQKDSVPHLQKLTLLVLVHTVILLSLVLLQFILCLLNDIFSLFFSVCE